MRSVAIFLLMFVRWCSGMPPKITGIPYWYLSYFNGGLIRRAFVGTISAPLLSGLPLKDAALIVNIVSAIGSVFLIATLAWLLRSHLFVAAMLIVSGALAWLATDLSNLDPFILLAVVWAFILINRNNPIGLILCAVTPLIHEGGIFILLPVLGGLFALRPDVRYLSLAGVAVVAATVLSLWLFSTNEFTWPAGMPAIDPAMLDEFRRIQVGQSAFLLAIPHIDSAMILFSVLPALAIAGYVATQGNPLHTVIVLGGIVATSSLVLIATDTDRLLAWTPFTAALLAVSISPRSVFLREPYFSESPISPGH